MPRRMSLDSGVILWRLNHELLPDPGNPIARMTLPLDTRGAAGGEVFAAAGGTGASASPSGPDSVEAPADGAATADLEPPLPLPPRPRRRLRRGSPGPPVFST